MVAHVCNPTYLRAEIGRIQSQGQIRQIVHKTPSPKMTKAEFAGGVTQAVEHLLCKLEALSLNHSPNQKKKKKLLLFKTKKTKFYEVHNKNKSCQVYSKSHLRGVKTVRHNKLVINKILIECY
jgi:hypothetical protein